MYSLRKRQVSVSGLLKSTLHDEKTFYPVFLDDLKQCKKEVIIESPCYSKVLKN